MHLLGHVGFTLGLVTAIQKIRGRPPVPVHRLLVFAGFALLPDILDKTLHLILPKCPDHLIFHSVFFYLIALLIVWQVRPRWLVYVAIMAFHLVLDLPNDDPRYLAFPLFGWRIAGPMVEPLGQHVMNQLPAFLSTKIWVGHYLVFEMTGAFLTLWAFRVSTKSHQQRASEKQQVTSDE